MTKINEINQQEFIRDWNSYVPATIMAEKYNMQMHNVGRIAKRLGLNPRIYRKKDST